MLISVSLVLRSIEAALAGCCELLSDIVVEELTNWPESSEKTKMVFVTADLFHHRSVTFTDTGSFSPSLSAHHGNALMSAH